VIFVPNEALTNRSFFRHPAGQLAVFLLILLLAIMSWMMAYLKLQKEGYLAEKKRIAEELEDLYENAPCGYHSLDAEGMVLRMNRTELDWLGYERDEIVGKKCYFDLSPPESKAEREQSFKKLLSQSALQDHVTVLQRKDGSILPVSIHASTVVDSDGNYVQSRSSVVDITERRQLEQKLERQAQTDVLTGLCNRRHFYSLGKKELSRTHRLGTTLSVLMIDIDRFKSINDTYGHDVGDQVLMAMAQACTPQLRENDLLARLGGEEFAVLLPDTQIATAEQVANRLRETLAQMAIPLAGGNFVSFTVSAGVAALADPQDGLDTLLKRADVALYRAKRSGRNRVCVA
jgi:diguanylate cyclase (GGDEF)-like protein/PAS domain S-box-containing protein